MMIITCVKWQVEWSKTHWRLGLCTYSGVNDWCLRFNVPDTLNSYYCDEIWNGQFHAVAASAAAGRNSASLMKIIFIFLVGLVWYTISTRRQSGAIIGPNNNRTIHSALICRGVGHHFAILLWWSDPSATGIRKALHGGAFIDQSDLPSIAIVFALTRILSLCGIRGWVPDSEKQSRSNPVDTFCCNLRWNMRCIRPLYPRRR